ncbi:MAG: prolyl oligopeptidase family serine peptidase [Pirellulaceae bacterium]|jgi:prolyl oligopeptidase|nr:prolyl oligopeptidase family serine peptidase [Pirellulaceae bacterium]
MRRATNGLTALAAWSICCAGAMADEQAARYPETTKVEQVDDYHGTSVADPYRWLEDDVRTSEQVAAWVAAQNKVTFAYLESLPHREQIRARLTELWDYEKYGSPFKTGGRYFYFHNTGLQNQSVLFTMDTLDGPPRALLDPNTWSPDGTVALAGTAPSDDGRYLAYGIQDGGSDWRTWRILELASGKLLDDELKWIKFSGVSWTRDGSGLFYSRYDEPSDDAKFQSLNLNQKIFFHRVGTPQAQDVLVYCRPDQPEWGFQTTVTEDGDYLVITVWKGTDDKYRILYKDLREPYGMPIELVDNFDHEFTFVGNDGTTFYFKSDLDAPRRRLLAIDIRQPGRDAWKEIIPQADNVLTSVSFVGNLFVAQYLKDARTQVLLYSPAGELVQEVELPGIGTADGFGGRRTDTETFYTYSSFAVPPSIYRLDLITRTSRLLRRADVKFNPDDYVTEQVFYTSKDGTRVPMFLTHKKGTPRDGAQPTLLYGYGGFNIPLTPSFSVSRVAWMELGGTYAVANLRGGGEYGEAWHRAGTKLNKQNVFDDFIAAAQWLIDNKYTNSSRLAIQGGSNGGLLVGACMTQRPDLFAACLPAVGVMDMLRFHKFTAGRFWVDDYGSSDNPEEFRALLAYSPYHNLRPGTRYPATLATTADTDDRVVPGHSFKFAARLQECQAGEAPVLIRIETRAGHGAGKPTTKIIEEIADQLAFLVQILAMR